MRRMGLVLATMALALLLAGGAAFAATVKGTDGDDSLLGTGERDRMSGGLGDDVMRGFGGDDKLRGGNRSTAPAEDGEDVLRGGRGNDVLGGEGGEDRVYGGRGDDYVNSIGDNAVDHVDCGPGVDTVNRDLVIGPDQQDVYENCEKSLG